MNDKEIFRLGTIRDVCEKRIRRKYAAQLLNVSVRQVQRLVTRFEILVLTDNFLAINVIKIEETNGL